MWNRSFELRDCGVGATIPRMATVRISEVILMLLALCMQSAATAPQLMTTCAETSPERRGGIGCSIVGTKLLPEGLKEPLFWHIDRFDSLSSAETAAGPAALAFEAAGTVWLMTLESQTADHHGGRHVAQVGPLKLPAAQRYAMQAQSAAFMPGMYSLVHHHSGVEAVYVLEGEACFETATRGFLLRKGDTLAIPGDTLMRAVVAGSTRRHVLAVIVHDAAQPATTRMDHSTDPPLAACK